MTAGRGPTLAAEQRQTLEVLADVLIPADGDMPSASEAGVGRKWVDRVLAARSDLHEALERVLREAKGREPDEELRRLEETDPVGLGTLQLVVAGAYYLNPRIRKLIGYPGQKAQPPYPDEADYYLAGGLVAPVIERGPFYREHAEDAGTARA